MSHLRPAFEKELKFRVSQKTKSNQSEDKVLISSFKYFDLNNTGILSKDDFFKAILKIGINSFDRNVIIVSKYIKIFQELFQLFDIYDLDKDGKLSYKDFASIIYGNSTAITRYY